MAHFQLTVQPRDEFGSAATRRLRRSGMVPGILYQSGRASLPFALAERELRRLLSADGVRTQVIDLAIGSGAPRPALLKEWQVDPVRGDILHVDMAEVNLREAIQAQVPLVLVGQSAGVRDGGVLDQPVHTVTVQGLPDALPEALEYDVTALEIGGTVHLSDVVAPHGVTIVDDPETVVASVTPPSVVEVPEVEGAEEPELVERESREE